MKKVLIILTTVFFASNAFAVRWNTEMELAARDIAYDLLENKPASKENIDYLIHLIDPNLKDTLNQSNSKKQAYPQGENYKDKIADIMEKITGLGKDGGTDLQILENFTKTISDLQKEKKYSDSVIFDSLDIIYFNMH